MDKDLPKRVLIYVEPVVFRGNPALLAPHMAWASKIIAHNSLPGVRFAIVSSRALIDAFRALGARPNAGFYPLDPWALLAPAEFDRVAYSSALYDSPSGCGVLLTAVRDALSEVRAAFDPDLVVCSSQNAAIEQVFADRRTLFIEQAPLPRQRRLGAMFFDPAGHQTQSLLTLWADRILQHAPPAIGEAAVLAAVDARLTVDGAASEKRKAVAEALQEQRRGRRLAALAMQPPDWVTFEGAIGRVTPEGLLARWLRDLPAGWAAVPFYHPVHRLSPELETSLSRSFDNLVVLPEALTQGALDLCVDLFDGLVTATSTVAMHAAISGLRVAVAGRSAFNGLLGRHSAQDLDAIAPLSPRQRASLVAFLSHRYCKSLKGAFAAPGTFLALAESTNGTRTDMAPYFDFADWAPERLDGLI